MNNGDLPAMPMVRLTEESQYNGTKYVEAKETYLGLTKRETFAMNAPDVPNWFRGFLHSTDVLYRQTTSKSAAEEQIYLFFKWRTYYADMLLRQLEK